ncbi:OmpA family protein [Leisingera methylohalidivorans]|uniref:Flagellar motor protein MotB n=1 Tax=Leisingera methylohalidivorans DSM 14336 TaxID=999552 RepID=V9VYM1_9RHOB|nr:OmpA family protein [Leisingera methylohalidivorans]AHD03776.1 flagellar motor protein MotB [Leisingera methylohalidivorans DSM 14336]
MIRLKGIFASVLGAGLIFAPPTLAQSDGGELSVEEITEAFKKQKTRGLVIVPSSAAAAEDPAEETATVAAAEEYNPVDRQTQINVQISFDFDSAALRADQAPKLANMCASMKALDGTVFQIIGHTDSSGSAAYNERLSLLRAQEVRRHLISSCGVSEDMLKAIGMGETAPFNENNTRADENRRVEFQALG